MQHAEASYQLGMLYHKEKISPDIAHDSTDVASSSGTCIKEIGARKAAELLEQAVRGGHSLAKYACPAP